MQWRRTILPADQPNAWGEGRKFSLRPFFLDDWLDAERQILGAQAAEVVEKGDLFVLRIPLAGFTPVEVAVVAGPNEIVLRAGTTADETVSRHSRDQLKVMRRFALPAAVDVDSVAATLNKGS